MLGDEAIADEEVAKAADGEALAEIEDGGALYMGSVWLAQKLTQVHAHADAAAAAGEEKEEMLGDEAIADEEAAEAADEEALAEIEDGGDEIKVSVT